MFQRWMEFLKESRAELAKISWPTRDELKGSTVVVIVSVIVLTVFIGLVDQVFNVLFKELFQRL